MGCVGGNILGIAPLNIIKGYFEMIILQYKEIEGILVFMGQKQLMIVRGGFLGMMGKLDIGEVFTTLIAMGMDLCSYLMHNNILVHIVL